MSSGDLLNVDPAELKFPFEVKKQVSCSLQVSNKTDNHVAFKVKTTNPKNYCVKPNTGVVSPRSISEVVVTMQAQKEPPPDMQCKDKFLIQSVVTSPGTTAKDVTTEMFNKENGKVEECRLKVAFVSPRQPPPPVAEESDEVLSPRSAVVENGHEGGRVFADSHENTSEVRSHVAKLKEEKASAIKQGTKLRQEIELLTQNDTKSGGVSITLVIIIGMLGAVLGYFLIN